MKNDNTSTVEGPIRSAGDWRCSNPIVGKLLFSYRIGDLSQDDTRTFEQHLRECATCMSNHVRLEAVARIVRANPAKFFARATEDEDA